MIKLYKIVSIISLTVALFNNIQAQTKEIEYSSLNGSEVTFPPLKTVIDSVLKRSGMLNFRKHHIGVKEATLASERIYWTRNFGLQAETKYGNLNSFSTDSDGQISSAALVTTEQVNYSVGFYFKFPIFDAINRKKQVKLAKLEIEEAKSMAEFQEEEIRQAVIKLYQELILKQKLLHIKSKSFGAGKVSMEMVEKEFRNGVVPTAEYVRISGITSNLEADYEIAKSEFLTIKQLLEDLAGFSFDSQELN
ncbi:TolC family protein [Mariniflexile jejuense]|uniref:TolC family protein n=1 Tax=Mariniflexile jejuense TaxID=1173582 RepID=A0ABW3JEM2_9FLAO